MSRCFPYPPPGYEKSAALIESMLKLQKEREKTKKERKKEKKRGKKEEGSRGDNGKKEDKQHDDRRRQYGKFSQSNNKSGEKLKTREDEFAQVEGSSLTEEQGPAVVQNLCDSPDSTQNSSKRKKHESTAEVSHSAHGFGLRIRLPLLRHKDVEPPSSAERPCFSGRIETVPAQRETRATGHPELPYSARQPCVSGEIDATPSEELLTKVSHGGHASAEAGTVSSCNSDLRRQYRKLIRNWNPPPLRMENPELDDQDWLLGSAARQHHEQGDTRGQVARKDPDLGNALCSWPPRACYLPEVGIHALPYVDPF